MNVFKRICFLVVGFVLFMAGLLKLMDPVGAGLQLAEYFKFFHLGFLAPASLPLACVMAFVETLLGAAAITGVWYRISRWLVLGIMAFFTILTAVILAFNPDMECGCFGEAIHLTHEQSFLKNLILLGLSAVQFIPSAQDGCIDRIKYVGFGITALSVLFFAIYSLMYLPLVDYTSMKPGTEMVELGVSDLPVCNSEGEYCDTLAYKGRVVLVSLYDTEGLDAKRWSEFEDFTKLVESCGLRSLILVSGDPETLPPHVYTSDHRTLMTLNRSNGGAVYIADGLIIKKWPSRSLPEEDDLVALAEESPMETLLESNSPQRAKLQGFLLYVFAVMLLI